MDVKGSIDGDGIFALNCIIGGLIGGVVLSFKIIGIVGEFIGIVTGHFWTFAQRWDSQDMLLVYC